MKVVYVWFTFLMLQCLGLGIVVIGLILHGDFGKWLWPVYGLQAIGCLILCIDKTLELTKRHDAARRGSARS